MSQRMRRAPSWLRELAWMEGWVSLLLLMLVLAVALITMVA